MRIKTFRISDESNLDEITSALKAIGLEPLLGPTRISVETSLQALGFTDSSRILPDVEVCASPERDRAIALRRSRMLAAKKPKQVIEVLLLGKDGPTLNQLQGAVLEATPIKLIEHSGREQRALHLLHKSLGEPSPNGKLLADEAIQTAARNLKNDRLRDQLKEAAKAFNNRPVGLDTFARLESFENDRSALDSLLSAHILIEYCQVVCRGCKEPHLTFIEKEAAQRAADSAYYACPTCKSRELTVQPAFGIPETYLKNLQQGVWLESLAFDVCRGWGWSNLVWAGQMVGPSEVDTLAIYGDRSILIECKDTSFGMTDLDVAAAKVARVRATDLLIMTTRDVHPNVSEAVAQNTKNELRIKLIASNSASEIEDGLNGIFQELTQEFLAGWLRDGGGGLLSAMNYYTYAASLLE